ncbi:MAG: hypothetical protein ACO4B3_11365, partial [Planctomycetota bacterium]
MGDSIGVLRIRSTRLSGRKASSGSIRVVSSISCSRRMRSRSSQAGARAKASRRTVAPAPSSISWRRSRRAASASGFFSIGRKLIESGASSSPSSAPATSAQVAIRSCNPISESQVEPAGIVPGHFAANGTR